jgi:hypothetical protein
MKKNGVGGERTGILIVLETSVDTLARAGTARPGFSSRHTQAFFSSPSRPRYLSALGAWS